MAFDLTRIRELADAASRGPWEVKVIQPHMDGRCQYRVGPSGPGGFMGLVFPQDAEFIAAARSAVPAMCDEIERLDGAMHSVWLHGKWRWLTRNMTTEEREAAADAVTRYSTKLDESENDPLPTDQHALRWWRDSTGEAVKGT